MEENTVKPKIKAKKKEKDVLFKLVETGPEYSFNIIKIRSKYAPMREIDLLRIRGKVASGLKEIDLSEIRVCKIGKSFYLITGYEQLEHIIQNAHLDDKGQKLFSVKVMAETYLATAALETPAITAIGSDTSVVTKTVKDNVSKVPKKAFKEQKSKAVVEVPGKIIDNSTMKAQFESAGFKVR